MTATVLYNCQLYVDGFDYTGHSNSVEVSVETDDQDLTVFGTDGWKQRASGLKDCSAKADVFWQSAATDNVDAVDVELFGKLGVVQFPVTMTPSSTETDTAYMFRSASFAHSVLGDVGDLSMTNLELTSSDTQGLIRGKLAKAKGNISSAAAFGTGCQFSAAVSSTQFLYATFHVFAPGTTLTVVVESDDNSGFTTATTRATIGPITTRTGTWMTRVAGPIATDTWYRFRATTCTGTFSVGGAIAIQ